MIFNLKNKNKIKMSSNSSSSLTNEKYNIIKEMLEKKQRDDNIEFDKKCNKYAEFFSNVVKTMKENNKLQTSHRFWFNKSDLYMCSNVIEQRIRHDHDIKVRYYTFRHKFIFPITAKFSFGLSSLPSYIDKNTSVILNIDLV